MKWATHQRITSRILRKFTDDFSLVDIAVQSSIAPDKIFQDWKDHRFNAGGLSKIQTCLQNARTAILIDNEEDAFNNIGIAGHYIADGMTAVHMLDIPGDDPEHINYEMDIESLDVSHGVTLMNDAISDKDIPIMGPSDIGPIIGYMKNRRKKARTFFGNFVASSEDDLYLTYYFIYQISKNVFSGRYLPGNYTSVARESIHRITDVSSIRKHLVISLTIAIIAFMFTSSIVLGFTFFGLGIYFKKKNLMIMQSVANEKDLYAFVSKEGKLNIGVSPKKAWFVVPREMYM